MESLYKFLSGVLIVLISCRSVVVEEPNPEDIAHVVYEDLFKRSFKYVYRYGVKGEVPVYAEFKGKFCPINNEVRKGYMELGLNRVNIDVICIDGYQYTKERGRWRIERRDEAINILLDLKRLYNPRYMRFKEIRKGSYIYETKLDVSYIIPGTYRKIRGFVYIDRNYNLRRIEGYDTLYGVFIDLRLGRWDRVGRIEAPLKRVVTVELDRPLSKDDRKNFISRMRKLGIPCDVGKRRIHFSIPVSKDRVESLMEGGKVEIYEVVWGGGEEPKLMPTWTVEVRDRLDIHPLDFTVKEEEGRYVLYLRLNREGPQYVGVKIDGELYAVGERKGMYYVFRNVGTYDDCIHFGLRLTFPLNCYKIIKYRRRYG